MSCGCQKRKASNGAIACSTCINALELKIKSLNQIIQPKQTQHIKLNADKHNT
jgi:hypothetical protein